MKKEIYEILELVQDNVITKAVAQNKIIELFKRSLPTEEEIKSKSNKMAEEMFPECSEINRRYDYRCGGYDVCTDILNNIN